MQMISTVPVMQQQPQPFIMTAYPIMTVSAPQPEQPVMLPFFSDGPILVPVLSDVSMAPMQPINMPLWAPADIPVIPDLTQQLPLVVSECNHVDYTSACNTLPVVDSLSLPLLDPSFTRSRSGSADSCDSYCSGRSWSVCSSQASSDWSDMEQPSRGHKQELITQVRETLGNLLAQHFPHKMAGTIMSAFAHEYIPNLDELKDVLRGNHVGNIRAKSVRSLNVLVEFLQKILNCPGVSVHRVDVILQKKKTGHLKGLLVNVQFSSQDELLHVRDTIWKGQEGYEFSLPKFMPAVFAQDCSWKGSRPRNLKFVQTSSGDLRVQAPLPNQLEKLGLEANCRIKSMTVIFKTGSKNKTRTFEVPKEQFNQVLSEGIFETKGVRRTLNEKTRLTVSFEEDWKTDFWRC